MQILRRLLIVSHRYLGIALSLLAIMWFVTGITMMYVGGMPRLTPQLPVIDFAVDLDGPARVSCLHGGLIAQMKKAHRPGAPPPVFPSGSLTNPAS